MTPVNQLADEGAPDSHPAPGPAVETESSRDWLRLAAAHLRIAATSPALAATLFAVLSPDRNSLLHWGGILALLVTILCTYLFFGVFAFMGVLIASPFLWLISKLPSSITGFILSLVFSIATIWLLCRVLAKDMPAFQYAAVATAALGSAALERAWRRTRPRAVAQPPESPKTFP
jgi:hypothetical protein